MPERADKSPTDSDPRILLEDARRWLIYVRNYIYLAPGRRHDLEALIKSLEEATK